MSALSSAFVRQKIAVDFESLKHACPKGIYVAPLPPDLLVWTGVMFVRKGPYANAILRFQLAFPDAYPQRPPIVTFQSDVFHPLVTPLTTYTYSTRDTGSDTVSAVDEERLPPGGLSLRHGFPEWFRFVGDSKKDGAAVMNIAGDGQGAALQTSVVDGSNAQPSSSAAVQPPHVLEVLQYMRIVFDNEDVLDSIPIEHVANAGAWHAWRSFRARAMGNSKPGSAVNATEAEAGKDRGSASPRQQPGGARRPGEWNWQGVWEDRVRKSIQASISHPVLFGHDNDIINFLKMDQEALEAISPLRSQSTTT